MIYTITGGTGTFGRAFAERLLSMDVEEVRIFSRDEAKQWEMKRQYKDERLKYFLGDVRDEKSMEQAFRGADVVFHAAAMKHVWSCEDFPVEAMRTNAIGTANAISMAIAQGVSRFVLLSSDKAVFPTGAMGITKAMAEKVALSFCGKGTDIVITRFGNIIDSRGNVIDAWHRAMAAGEPLVVTDLGATRFFMTSAQAMDLVVDAVENGEDGQIVIPDCKAAYIADLLKAYEAKYDYRKNKVTSLGEGEKLHEWLNEGLTSLYADKYTQQELMEMI